MRLLLAVAVLSACLVGCSSKLDELQARLDLAEKDRAGLLESKADFEEYEREFQHKMDAEMQANYEECLKLIAECDKEIARTKQEIRDLVN